ncbi:Hypothetical predicted protein, partial [Marmota monax]
MNAPHQVRCELQRRWPGLGLHPPQPSGRDYRLHSWSISRNGSESALQTHRDGDLRPLAVPPTAEQAELQAAVPTW